MLAENVFWRKRLEYLLGLVKDRQYQALERMIVDLLESKRCKKVD
jgi:hypothetical protein